MAKGPGKYDLPCTMVRGLTDAVGVVLIVLGGNRGSGFSVQTIETREHEIMAELPTLLREIATQVEDDLKKERH